MNDLQKEIKNNKIIRNFIISDEVLKDESFLKLRADGLKFINVNLSGSNLSEIHWRNCQMENVILEKTVFHNANIRMCQWNNVRAAKSDFSSAIFENSYASGCVFDGANFTEAKLTDTNFSRADFCGAILDGVDASGASFRGADLRNASLKNANFVDADLRGADLTGANLQGVDFNGADLQGAIIDEAFQPQQKDKLFSPALEEMAGEVAPIVAQLLRKGAESELFDAQAQVSMMEELQQYGWTESAADSDGVNKEIDAVLNAASKVGIAPLLEALQQQGDEPPQAVATLLEELSAGFKMAEGANTEDLLKRLVESFKTTAPDKSH